METDAADENGYGARSSWADVLMKRDGRWRILSSTQID
jgi:hypothetical protein